MNCDTCTKHDEVIAEFTAQRVILEALREDSRENRALLERLVLVEERAANSQELLSNMVNRQRTTEEKIQMIYNLAYFVSGLFALSIAVGSFVMSWLHS